MYALRPQIIDFNEVWGDLRRSVVNIIELQPITRIDWNHKFNDVYNICVAIPDPLCDRLYSSLVGCIEDHVRGLCRKIEGVPLDQLLYTYAQMWKIFHEGTVYVHMLFGYLNKQYVKTKRNLDPDLQHNNFQQFLSKNDIKEVGCMALDIWKNRLIRPIFDKLLVLLLEAIAKDRKGNPPMNKTVIQDTILSFVQVEQHDLAENQSSYEYHTPKQEMNREFYQTYFEMPFLQATEEHYTHLAHKLLSDLSCSRYMEEVIHIIEAEKLRSTTYVHKSTVDKVIKLCQNVMVSAHKEKLNGVCSELIRNEEHNDLRNMYKLMKPIDGGLTVMVREFEDYVKKKGLEVLQKYQIDGLDLLQAVSNLSGDNIHNQFVENVLQVFDRYSEMKMSVFMDDGDFTGALDKALQTVVNVRPDRTVPCAKASERLARYCDALLRKNTKGLAEVDLDTRLARAIVIFRYIEDKDVFQKFYSKMLSNRLINGSSVSMDAEESMINKLKACFPPAKDPYEIFRLACGYEFTSKLTRMFTDIGLCTELQNNYEVHLQETGQKTKFAMCPYVLTAGSWPLSAPTVGGSGTPPAHVESIGFILPLDLKSAVDRFQEYYTTKYNGRRLTWLYTSCSGDLRTTYLDKNYLISGSLFQISTLMIFNYRDSLTVGDISASVGITGDLILKICQTHVVQGLLTCADKDLTLNSVLTINPNYSSRRLKFKLPAVQSTKQAEKEVESVNHTVAQDRKYYVECAVVRIMKTRKVLRHTQLVNEVMEQIKGRFKPDLPLVKKCVEDLIDKMYLQRTDKHDEYQYLA